MQKIVTIFSTFLALQLHAMDNTVTRLDHQCVDYVGNSLIKGILDCSDLKKLPESCKELIKESIIHNYSHILWKCFYKKCTGTTLTGHTDGVDAVGFCGNDQAITTALDKTIKIWNIETGECLKTFNRGACSLANQITVDLANKLLSVSFLYARVIEKYDLNSGQLVQKLDVDHAKGITANIVPTATKNIQNRNPDKRLRAVSPNKKFTVMPTVLSTEENMEFEKKIGEKAESIILIDRAPGSKDKSENMHAAAISHASNFFIIASGERVALFNAISDCIQPEILAGVNFPDSKKKLDSVAISPDDLSFIVAHRKHAKIVSIKKTVDSFLESRRSTSECVWVKDGDKKTLIKVAPIISLDDKSKSPKIEINTEVVIGKLINLIQPEVITKTKTESKICKPQLSGDRAEQVKANQQLIAKNRVKIIAQLP